MIPHKTIEDLIKKHSLLEKDLSSATIDKKLFAEKSKEYSDLNDIIQNAKKYISYEKDKLEIQKILDDKKSDLELIKMAEMELNDLKVENENKEVDIDFEVCNDFLDYMKFETGKTEISQEELGDYVRSIILKSINNEDGYSIKQDFIENNKTNIDK